MGSKLSAEQDHGDEEDIPEKRVKSRTEFKENEVRKRLFQFVRSGKKDKLSDHLKHIQNHFQSSNANKMKMFLNEADERGNTPQHYAAKAGLTDIFDLLTEYGADVNAKGQHDLSIVEFAARYGENEEKVWNFLEHYKQNHSKHFNTPSLHIHNNQQGLNTNILHLAIQNEHWGKENSSSSRIHRNHSRQS